MATAGYNERAWAIDLIGHLKQIAHSEHQPVRDVGGEQSVADDDGTLFPDVLLFGDRDAALILQGWELKFPDTDIEDEEFRDNAEQKARMLGLDSFVLWNVRYARLFKRDPQQDSYELYTEWTDLHDIRHRPVVRENRVRWETLGAKILHAVNTLISSGDIEGRPFVEAYRSGGLASLVLANTERVASDLKRKSKSDRPLRADITLWWDRYHNEYDGDDPYAALAKANLLNWMGKFLMAHVLRERDQRASIVAQIGGKTTPEQALAIFDHISQQCNFAAIFCDSLGLEAIPDETWKQLLQFNNLLSDLRVGAIDQVQLSALLEASATVGNRKLRGQYTTPPSLAKLLVRLGIGNFEGLFLDPCCGSGTIARAALDIKLDNAVAAADTAAQVYASDFDPQAVQLATFSLASPLLMREPLRICQQDAFELKPGLDLEYRNPNDGSIVRETLRTFHCIASNLPFVSQNGRETYRAAITRVNAMLQRTGDALPNDADISAYLPFVFMIFSNPAATWPSS